MKKNDIMERILNGEDSYTQFKEQIISAKDLAKEFVAFTNAQGGIIIFGVADNGEIVGLDKAEIKKIGQLVGNCANENVKPPIHPLTENKIIGGKKIIIVTVNKGINKPYATSSGDYYTKSSSDKKKISQDELRRLFAESKKLFADEEILENSNINDLNTQIYYQYLKKANQEVLEKIIKKELSLETILENEVIMRDGHLTLAGNLIFGIDPQKFNKSFYVNCCYFDGNDISVNKYISKKRITGTFERLYDESLSFIKSNLRSRQVKENFNSNGVLEINEIVLGELIVNALVHRDYYINSSIKIFVFHNRVEIISPGKLTNSLTIENIKSGRSIARNPILDSICENILTYSGYGSGIRRVLKLNSTVEFINDVDQEQFKCIILRSDTCPLF